MRVFCSHPSQALVLSFLFITSWPHLSLGTSSSRCDVSAGGAVSCEIGPTESCGWSASELELCSSIVVNGTLEVSGDVDTATPMQVFAVGPHGRGSFAGNVQFHDIDSFAVHEGANLLVAGALSFQGEVGSFAIFDGATVSIGAELRFQRGANIILQGGTLEIGLSEVQNEKIDMTECPDEFTEPLFRFFFEEECLSQMPADASGQGCPIQAVEDYMKALLGEYQLFSLLMAPVTYFFLYILTITAKCPAREGFSGRLFFVVWVTLQIMSLFFLVISLAIVVASYVSCHWNYHPCLAKLGTAQILHLVFPPMCLLVMPAVNKLAPLWLLLFAAVSATDSGAEGGCAARVLNCLPVLFLAVVMLSACYCTLTLGVVFCWPFVPIPFLQTLLLAGLLLCIRLTPSKVMEGKLGFNPSEFAEKIITQLPSWQGGTRTTEADMLLLLYLPLIYIILSPFTGLGVMYAFLVYDGHSSAIRHIYDFIINPELFVLPSVVDAGAFLEDPSTWMESIGDIFEGFDLPPVQLLTTGAAMSVVATLIAALKNIIAVGNMVSRALIGYGFQSEGIIPSAEDAKKIEAACKDGTVDSLKSMRADGVAIQRAKDLVSGRTAAMWACEYGQLAVVKYLHRDLKANFNAKDSKGRTAAMLACREGQLEVLRYLHAEVQVDFATRDAEGKTAAIHACAAGQREVVEYLHLEVKADFDARAKDGWTAAMQACSDGHLEVVRYLHTAAGADFEAKSRDGETAASLASAAASKTGNSDVWEYLSSVAQHPAPERLGATHMTSRCGSDEHQLGTGVSVPEQPESLQSASLVRL